MAMVLVLDRPEHVEPEIVEILVVVQPVTFTFPDGASSTQAPMAPEATPLVTAVAHALSEYSDRVKEPEVITPAGAADVGAATVGVSVSCGAVVKVESPLQLAFVIAVLVCVLIAVAVVGSAIFVFSAAATSAALWLPEEEMATSYCVVTDTSAS